MALKSVIEKHVFPIFITLLQSAISSFQVCYRYKSENTHLLLRLLLPPLALHLGEPLDLGQLAVLGRRLGPAAGAAALVVAAFVVVPVPVAPPLIPAAAATVGRLGQRALPDIRKRPGKEAQTKGRLLEIQGGNLAGFSPRRTSGMSTGGRRIKFDFFFL